MDIGLHHVAVGLSADGFGTFFFFENSTPGLGNHGVDLSQDFFIQMADIFRKSGVVDGLFKGAGDR